MAGPTIEDLLHLAEGCSELKRNEAGFYHRGFNDPGRDRFVDAAIHMFGDDVEMAKALIGQIHALQAQIRTMRAEQEGR